MYGERGGGGVVDFEFQEGKAFYPRDKEGMWLCLLVIVMTEMEMKA
jgi:hypothetical protein